MIQEVLDIKDCTTSSANSMHPEEMFSAARKEKEETIEVL